VQGHNDGQDTVVAKLKNPGYGAYGGDSEKYGIFNTVQTVE
jgi:hypothetical protein